jgi:N-methylhydantoinase B
MAVPDPVTVEVIRNGFQSVANTMNNNLARAAYNPVIYEMKDCSVGIFDADVRLLGQSPGLPIFVGGFDTAIRCTLDFIGGPAALNAGDVFAVNDSELVGSHLNDVTVLTPIFAGTEVVGYAITKAHWRDIGAKSPGHAMDSTDIYQEGYRLAPTRVYRGGEPDHGVLDLLTRNSRLPRGVWGDLHAQIAACRTGERGLLKLHERFGRPVVEAAARVIFDHAEHADRNEVASMPDGEWVHEGLLDSWGPGGDPVPVRVRVVVDGDEMTIDLRGSSERTAGNVNCGRAQTVAAARLAFKFLVNPELSVSDGSFRNLTVLTDEDSIFDARSPAACQYYYPHLGLMIDLVIKALSDPCPERVVAGEPADAMNVLLTGIVPQTGKTFVCGEATAVGSGAYEGGDGTNGTANYGAGDLKNLPVEVIEARYPVRINHYGLRPGSGGMGRWRGGLGIERQYEMLADDIKLSLWWERTLTPGWGLFGGEAGSPGEVVVETNGGATSILKVNGLPLSRGDRVTVKTGGGGGFGPAGHRDAAARDSDIVNGYIPQGESS